MKAATIVHFFLFCSMVEAHYPTKYPHVSFMGQTLANHSYVDLSQVGISTADPGNTVRCCTDLCTCCSNEQGDDRGGWFLPNGGSLSTSSYDYGMRYGDGRVDVYRQHHSMPQGIYRCDIETKAFHGDQITAGESVFAGLYFSNEGDVHINSLLIGVDSDLNGASPQFTLTCISTGGPATTVTWTRDSTRVGGTTKTVLEDPVTAHYIHNLTVTGRRPGFYTCIVANNKPSMANARLSVEMASVPPNLIAIRKGSREIQLNWDQPPPTAKTIGYTIEYQSHRGESIGVDIDLSSTSYQVTGLMNGIRYNVAFISRSNHYYQRISIPIAMVPEKPSVSIAAVTSSSIDPFWSVSRGSVVTSYTVTWKSDISFGCHTEHQGSHTTPDNSSTIYTITGLEENSRYIITVSARNGAGTGPESEPLIVETNAAAPSAAPTSVRVTEDSSTTITVQWEGVDCIHRNGNITGYSVRYSHMGTTLQKTSNTTTKVTISGLSPSTTYIVEVAGVTSLGIGNYSLPLNATTDGRLSMIGGSTSPTSLTVSLQLAAGSQAIGYTLTYQNVNNTDCFRDSDQIGGNQTTYTLNLLGNTEYIIAVSAELSIGEVEEDSFITVTAVAAPSVPPTSVEVSVVNSTTITVQWGQVPCRYQNGAQITGYWVRHGEVGSGNTQTMSVSGDSVTETTISSLLPSTNHSLQVAAVNGAGTGIYSTPVSVLIPEMNVYVSLRGRVIPNNGYAIIDDIGSWDNAVLCHTDRAVDFGDPFRRSGGNWFAPDGTRVNENDVPGFYRNRGPMVVRLHRTDSTGNQGIYNCTIQDATTKYQAVYVGLYYPGNGVINISGGVLYFSWNVNRAIPQFTLTCISTGGPATTVTWTRDATTVTQGTETVLNDPVTAQYTHTLTVTTAGEYTCTVSNNKPSTASASITVRVASAPTNLMVVQEDLTSVRVSWTPPTPLGDTTGYRIDFISSGNDTGSVNVSDWSSGHCVLHGLIREATYYISIVATSEHHLPSHSLNSQITLVPLPSQPATNALSATATSISLSWRVPSGSTTVTGSEVVWKSTDESFSESEGGTMSGPPVLNGSGVITDTSYTIVFNSSGTYNISVVLVNEAGYGVSSQPVIFTVNHQGEDAEAAGNRAVVAGVAILAVMLVVAVIVIVVILLRPLGRHCYSKPKQQQKAAPTKIAGDTSKVEEVASQEGDIEEDPSGYVMVDLARYSPREPTSEEFR